MSSNTGVLTIASRFCGPRASANGGYAAGSLAAFLDGDVESTLRRPPPLDTPLAIERDGERVLATHDGALVAEARPTAVEVELPELPSWGEAEAAAGKPPWRRNHPFPTCFVCGPDRAPRDGLRIFPGAVAGRGYAAATWIPTADVADTGGAVSPAIVWAALDCPSWFGAVAADPALERPALLGRMSVHLERQPRVGERWMVIGWLLGAEGRKIHSASAMVAADGAIGSTAVTTWICLR